MRLAGPVPGFDPDEPAAFARRARSLGYSAVTWPVGPFTGDPITASQERALLQALADEDVVVAEVNAWSNPISTDADAARRATDLCIEQLALADRVGARCCVNIAGSRNPDRWDGPHPDNLSPRTFDRIVRCVQEIVDAVRPTRTFYTLETMPWVFPDSPAAYLELIRAIDRPGFAAHLDPVNMINCPARLYDTTAFLQECFDTLGPWIRACHAKDVLCQPRLTLHIDEARPGEGVLDFRAYLRLIEDLDPELSLCLEHLPDQAAYAEAAAFIRRVGAEAGVAFR